MTYQASTYANLHDVGVVKQTVKHCRRQRLVVGEGAGPRPERLVAGGDDWPRS